MSTIKSERILNGQCYLTSNVFLCVLFNGKDSQILTNTIAANIKPGFIKFSIHFACFLFGVCTKRKFRIEMEMHCRKTWSKQKNSVLTFSFGFPIQLYGFMCPKKYMIRAQFIRWKIFSGVFLPFFTMAFHDLWVYAANEKQRGKKTERWKRHLLGCMNHFGFVMLFLFL